jgi:uncharacterized alkaline shock family protein YloU
VTGTGELAVDAGGDTVADPGRRGLLVLAPRVIERIAARVASEVDGVTRRGSASSSKGVQADADLEGSTAALALRLGVAYPSPVGRVASEVRRRVADRVQELTGVAVTAVRVTVDELPASVPPTRARAA